MKLKELGDSKDEILQVIVEKGKKIGALSYEELLNLSSDISLSDKEMHELLRLLEQEALN